MKADDALMRNQRKRCALKQFFRYYLLFAIGPQMLVWILASSTFAQSWATKGPLSRQELVQLITQLPKQPDPHDKIFEEIRNRGIGFALTDDIRTLVTSKGGRDTFLRDILEGADRRRAQRVVAAGFTEAEVNTLLNRTKAATLAALEGLPDFMVKQSITRAIAYDSPPTWLPRDTLLVRVRYQQSGSEEYKLLSINGRPPRENVKAGMDYSDYVGGASSAGEYVSALANIFKDDSRTGFSLVDTGVVRGRKTAVYEYSVGRLFSALTLRADKNSVVSVASRGRVWIDLEENRVLRFEHFATEIPADFPIRGASSTIDYDWLTINGKQYLVPVHAEVLITRTNEGHQLTQSFNDITFHDYQKFVVELKVYDIDDSELPSEKPDKHKKPSRPVKP
jgi:hypothetical protein